MSGRLRLVVLSIQLSYLAPIESSLMRMAGLVGLLVAPPRRVASWAPPFCLASTVFRGFHHQLDSRVSLSHSLIE